MDQMIWNFACKDLLCLYFIFSCECNSTIANVCLSASLSIIKNLSLSESSLSDSILYSSLPLKIYFLFETLGLSRRFWGLIIASEPLSELTLEGNLTSSLYLEQTASFPWPWWDLSVLVHDRQSLWRLLMLRCTDILWPC